jgi:hypothetical protein
MFVSLACLHRSLLPQSLTRLLPRLLIPHIVPKLGRVILLQKPSGGIQRSPIIDNSHRHQRLIQSFGREILSLSILDRFAIAFVPRVVVGASSAAEEAVVFARFGDAGQGPLGAACGAGGDFFLGFGFCFGGGASLVWFGRGCHGRILIIIIRAPIILGIASF